MASVIGIIGLTLGCANTVKAIIEKCNHLRCASKRHTKLESRYLAVDDRVKELKNDVEQLDEIFMRGPCDAAKAVSTLSALVRDDMKKAEFVLDEISYCAKRAPPSECNRDMEIGTPAQDASKEVNRKRPLCVPKLKSHSVKKVKHVFAAAFNIDNVCDRFVQAEQHLRSAIDRVAEIRATLQRQSLSANTTSILANTSSISEKTDLILHRLPHSVNDVYKPHFDRPSLSTTLVFNFDLRDDHSNARTTSEGRLLDAVLRAGGEEGSSGASALGTHGMGGVGKTTALKRICHHELVREMFTDGVFFLEFGQDANDAKVMSELVRLVCNSGGKSTGEKMREIRRNGNLGDVVDLATEWVKDRTILVVCDDIWATKNNELGYTHILKKLLRDAPQSTLLISTRDRKISRSVTNSPVSFDVLETHGEKAREILGKAAFGSDWERALDTEECAPYFDAILDTCAELPLTLAIAGSAIHAIYIDSESTGFAVRRYSSALERKGVHKLQEEANAEYHTAGLKYVVHASLNACDVWGRSDGRNYDMRYLFKSLCVIEKQQLIPESTLARYWSFNEDQIDTVLKKFADLNVVKLELFTKKQSDLAKEAGQEAA